MSAFKNKKIKSYFQVLIECRNSSAYNHRCNINTRSHQLKYRTHKHPPAGHGCTKSLNNNRHKYSLSSPGWWVWLPVWLKCRKKLENEGGMLDLHHRIRTDAANGNQQPASPSTTTTPFTRRLIG